MIKIINTEADLDAIRARWDELFEQSSTATPYQTFLFNKITWEVWHEKEDRLYIICYCQSEGAKVDAIIPCYINGKSELHIIDYLSDFCDGIIPDSMIERYAMYKEIVNYVMADDAIGSVCFNNLRQGSRMLAYMYAFGGHSEVKTLTGYTIVRMVPSDNDRDFIESIQNCNSTQRNKLRKRFKAASSLTFEEHHYPDEYPDADIREIADFMVHNMMRAKEYFEERFFQYFRLLYEAGLLTVVSHKGDAQPKAENFFLIDKKSNEYISWVTVYREKQDNTNLMLSSLDMMYKSGFANLNFARGVYAYKLSDFHPNIYTLNRLTIRRTEHEVLKSNLREALRREYMYIRQNIMIRLVAIKRKLHL